MRILIPEYVSLNFSLHITLKKILLTVTTTYLTVQINPDSLMTIASMYITAK